MYTKHCNLIFIMHFYLHYFISLLNLLKWVFSSHITKAPRSEREERITVPQRAEHAILSGELLSGLGWERRQKEKKDEWEDGRSPLS